MEAVQYFKSLADETRLRLINILLHYELNVNEIMEILNMGQSRVSRHLKILTQANLITCRRDGLWSFYSLAPNGEGHVFTSAIKYLFSERTIFSEDLKKARWVVEERARATTRFFNTVAENWDELKKEILGPMDLEEQALAFIPPVHTIADLGCGTGDLLPHLKDKAEILIGVDKSPKMLEKAHKRYNQDGRIDLRIGDLEHLPLREREADVAIVNMVLHHLPSPLVVFTEVYRILKSGGQLLLVDLLSHNLESLRNRYNDRWLGFSIIEINKWLKTGGFQPKNQKVFQLNKGLNGFILLAKKIEGGTQ